MDSTYQMEAMYKAPPRRSRTIALVLAIAAIFVFVSFHSIVLIYRSWQKEEYSYGYLIPFIALLISLNILSDTKPRYKGSWLGVVILVVCIAIEQAFGLAGIKGLMPQIMMVSIVGLVAATAGLRVVAVLAFPLAYLFFAAPLPDITYSTLSLYMQLLSTSLGTGVLDAMGYSVFRDGNIIDLGILKLQVVEACSGLRYLFPLLSFSFLVSYLYDAPLWKRVLVFLSAAPIAIVMNSLRIVIIGMTVNIWGAGAAEGFIHDFEGFTVFFACVALLLLEVRLLHSIGHSGSLRFNRLRLPRLQGIPPLTLAGPAMGALVLLIVGGVVAGVTASIPTYAKSIPLKQPFASFPTRLGPWSGRSYRLDPEIMNSLLADDYLTMDYSAGGEAGVNLYSAYYNRQDSTAAVHSPQLCIPGGGWKIADFSVRTLNLGGAALNVNRAVIEKGGVRQLVYYWFWEHGVQLTDDYDVKAHILTNALRTGQTNGALIRLVTPILPQETDAKADDRLVGFMNFAYPNFSDYLSAT